MKRIALLVLVVLNFQLSIFNSLHAQRLQQPLGRGVVAVNRSGSTIRSVTSEGGTGSLISWRKLAQEPEGTTYNVYKRTAGASDWTLVNSKPLTKTNLSTTLAANTEYSVAAIVNGVEGEKSVPFLYKTQAWPNVWFNFDFDNNVLKRDDYRTKYVWPMDTDGDGEFDALVADRLYAGAASEEDNEDIEDNTATTTHKIQAYQLDGTLLWTVDMGPNVNICAGQNDMVLAYDINCDGRCEVIIRSSDGTRFWDKSGETWGTYVGGSATADTDGDGITDYRTQTKRNPPFYISVIDGLTGAELAHNELHYTELSEGSGGDNYSRDNRSDYMSFGYGAMEGHYGIAYLDGIHPSLVMECEDRTNDKNHHGYILSWDYDWNGGEPTNWHHSHTWVRNPKRPWCAEFHQIRILDSDGDGCDEMWAGGYGVNPAQNRFTSTGLEHGDRFVISDIDPDRPGLEGYAIQQSAQLGQCLYDAKTGERIKEWYLPSVFDVGRGTAMDVDASKKGYEIYSYTDEYYYDCKGENTGKTRSGSIFEGVWWNGDLQREELNSPGGSGWGTNMMITTVQAKARLVEFSQESSWAAEGGTGTRPAFMGDIIGDWREEIILAKQSSDHSTGLVGYTTAMTSNYSIYCLQQDPHYRLDCTTRGYYQHPNTGYYLGGGMPLPPLPPVFEADVHNQLVDGKSAMFDINSATEINIAAATSPTTLYLMNPAGHDIAFRGAGTTGSGNLIKSMQGTAIFNGNLDHTGLNLISEGTLHVNGNIAGPVELRARGTLAGKAILEDTITFEGALNYEGCRLKPGNPMKSMKNVVLPGNVYMEIYDRGHSYLSVKGDLTFKGTNYITFSFEDKDAGECLLAECTGTLTCDVSKLKTRGLEGLNYDLVVRDNKYLVLVINPSRAPQTNVTWTGTENGTWDFKTQNFALNDEATAFVSGDEVLFPEEATRRTISINETMPTAGIHFTHNSGTYTLNGNGALSGEGNLVVDGTGAVVLNVTKNDFTGRPYLNNGKITVKNLEMAGTASCLGAGDRIDMARATLVVNNTNAATDRIITITDTATISIASGTATFKGQVAGKGTLVKAGNGQVNLAYGGANNVQGIILDGGTLAQGLWNSTLGKSGCPMLVRGNSSVSIFNNNSTSQVPTLTNAITIQKGKTLTIIGGQRCAVQGSLLGEGTVKISFPYVRGDVSTNMSKFEGTVNVTSGQFRLTAAMDLSKGTFQPDAGVYVAGVKSGSGTEQSFTHKIGALKSTATDAQFATGIWNVGYLGTNTTFAGKFNSTATLNKYGEGMLTLSGTSEGKMNVNAGTLSITGTAASIVVNKDATLAAMKSSSTLGTATLTGTLQVKTGGRLLVRGRGTTASTDQFKASGNITLASPIFVMERISGEWLPDVDYKVFTGDGAITLTGTPTFEPAWPASGYMWDYSSLASEGILRVVEDPTAITNVTHAPRQTTNGIYDLNGRPTSKKQRGITVHDGKKMLKR